ncbi:MAG: 16S rRNA processing protein RimM [Betaproteobacteria bacterium]|jgi:16S rRNA processing protein RimM|nr:MAG: 16S rRNA processing protein RimM [Betaproteobacteria bacterium]
MGRVAGSYGVRGWIKVVPGGGVAETLAGGREWWIAERPYEVSEARAHGATVVGKLAGIETREQALQLKGARVAMERAALGEPGEGHYILADLVGLEVRNEQDELLGTVKRWFSNGGQDVMEVAGERSRLIPWVSAIVKAVDVAGRRIVVDWSAEW